ncbi:DUF4062 domain-containing protein [Desulfosarcina sp. OttesenSCG-928-A07]|nr:DUF4062 domain-containing protein [Desulfosarcina sp. OttesenSCG-928-G10]MDL2328816.1 DUF4062 domain-containing protein [Desulfosarcina sp. OttesenSCG-928-A07]
MEPENRKLKIMVSSTVYGIEELLERIYTLLTAFGYEVWMSHKGTVPVFSTQTAFENCLRAVENCDLFLGLITPSYGSGQDPDDPSSRSITHHEILKAIELNKPRWLLAHENVVFARILLNHLGYQGKAGRKKLKLKKNPTFTDLRIIDLYEEATLDHEPPNAVPLAERRGNWVQKFRSDSDASIFVSAQFFRYQEVESFIRENFENKAPLSNDGGRP